MPFVEGKFAGRLVVIAPGAHWPSWVLSYRDLGPGDALIAHDSVETLAALLDRVQIAAVDMDALDLAPASLLLCLSEPREDSIEEADDVARKLSSLPTLREIVLVSCAAAGTQDGRRLHRLRRALHKRSMKRSKRVSVRIEAPQPSARKGLAR
ncbi:MAG TPA: hypothetical protein VI072_02835 [Polyangiaceae bacterium]